jgi:hypothetical protein
MCFPQYEELLRIIENTFSHLPSSVGGESKLNHMGGSLGNGSPYNNISHGARPPALRAAAAWDRYRGAGAETGMAGLGDSPLLCSCVPISASPVTCSGTDLSERGLNLYLDRDVGGDGVTSRTPPAGSAPSSAGAPIINAAASRRYIQNLVVKYQNQSGAAVIICLNLACAPLFIYSFIHLFIHSFIHFRLN